MSEISQKEAIEKTHGPCVILAGAGTGKTYTIVEKIKFLIEQGIYDASKIVCISFSNEAANNLLSRIQRILPDGAELPLIKTFHSFSAELLRKHGERIGINEDFNILTPEEAKVVMHRNFKINPRECHRYVSSIGTAKDLGITLEDIENFVEKEEKRFEGIDLEKRLENLQFTLQTLHLNGEKGKKKEIENEIARIDKLIQRRKFSKAWSGYEKLKEIKGYQDYSDLNNNALKLLKVNKDICREFDYVIIDEFQDTNKVQLDLIFELAVHGNLTVVGDLNQSIYQFRGAYAGNIELFKEHFSVKEKDVFNLDRSFRSSNKVLGVAHELILNNYERKEDCFEVRNAHEREGENVEAYELRNGKEEARKIVELIEKSLKEGGKEEEICVIFRTHQQARLLKKLLDFKGIEFCSVSKNSLFKQKSIRTVIDYLTILSKLKKKDKGGEQAWWDLIYQLGFLETDLVKIGRFVKENRDNESISQLLFERLGELELSDSGKMASKILIERIKVLLNKTNLSLVDFLRELYGIAGLISEGNEESDRERMLNLNKFYDLALNHTALYAPDLESFLHYLDSLKSLSIEIEAAELEQKGVRLMTGHATKGLEYDMIIVSNLAQKRFPIETYRQNPLVPVELYPEFKEKFFEGGDRLELEYQAKEREKANQLAEERRLCYVAFTRAKNKLVLTYANEYAKRKFYPSQFLQEIKYVGNQKISFFKDSDFKYEEPEIKIELASNFNGLINLGEENFEKDFLEVLKKSEKEKLKVSGDKKVFSPSSLLLFKDCQKKYEYKYVYNMPDEKTMNWEAIRLGSFVHLVLEKGVQDELESEKEFLDLSRELHMKGDWDSVDLKEAEHMIRVFFERNKNKFDENSRIEQELRSRIGDVDFIGFADRIDVKSDGLEIIDYKTNRGALQPRHRNWQLGYYALAAAQLNLGPVRKVTLEMLRQEKPLGFSIDEKGEAVSENGLMKFNIYDVEQELIKTAHEIREAYRAGFKACPVENNCEFCNEYVYGL